MYIDVFELVPDNDRPRKDCYDCLGCLHLVAISVDSTHNASIECDIDKEEKQDMKEETRKVVVLDMEDKIKLQRFIKDLEEIYNNYQSSCHNRTCIGNVLYYLKIIEEKIN